LDRAAAAPVSRPDGFRGGCVTTQEDEMKYGLLWLIGVPIPVLIVLFLLFH
jgi:hypothetical protein